MNELIFDEKVIVIRLSIGIGAGKHGLYSLSDWLAIDIMDSSFCPSMMVIDTVLSSNLLINSDARNMVPPSN